MANEFTPHRDGEEPITTADFFSNRSANAPESVKKPQTEADCAVAAKQAPDALLAESADTPITALDDNEVTPLDTEDAADIAAGYLDPKLDGDVAQRRVERYGGAFGLFAAGIAMSRPTRQQNPIRPDSELRAFRDLPGEPLIKRG